jgi:predicted DNA-binding transcriptional regulator AlpA
MISDEDLALGGYRYEDLIELRIVSNRTDLSRKQTDLGFPLPVKTGVSQATFLKSEVHDWLRKRAAMRGAPPVVVDRPPKRPMSRAKTLAAT